MHELQILPDGKMQLGRRQGVFEGAKDKCQGCPEFVGDICKEVEFGVGITSGVF